MEFIASGAQADIYRNEYMAIKLFKKEVPKSYVEYEMNLQKMAFELGLPVPEIYNIVEIEGKFGIVMEYIDGVPIGKIIWYNKSESLNYLIKTLELQISLNSKIAKNFPPMKERLTKNIMHASFLDMEQKQNILGKLEDLRFYLYLCHGDFHVNNLLETANGKIVIIDWIDSKAGNPEFDVCRTYILYKENSEELAEMYLDKYCEIAKKSRDEILINAPIVAAARLGENIQDKHKIDVLMGIIYSEGL